MDKFEDLIRNCEDANLLWNEGCNYYNGKNGVSQDYGKAFKLFEKAASWGSPAAENMLGVMCQNGQGVEKDESTAFSWYEKSAEHGYAWGQANAGYSLTYGIGTEVNYPRAIQLLENCLEQDQYGFNYFINETAFKDLLSSFNCPPPSDAAASLLGEFYEKGLVMDQDVLKAIKYHILAGRGHVNKAFRQLYYYSDYHVMKNLLSGLDMIPVDVLDKDARDAESFSQAILALCYKEGIGVNVDYKKAWSYLNMRDAFPFCSLKKLLRAQMYEKGEGVPASLPMALNQYILAVSDADKTAIAWLDDYFAKEPNPSHYEGRVQFADRIVNYCDYLKRYDPQKALSLCLRALAIAKEEQDKGQDKFVEIPGTAFLSTPRSVILNASAKIASIYESGALSGAPDYEKAIEYYKVARVNDTTKGVYHLAEAYRKAGREREEILLYINSLEEAVRNRAKNEGAFEFVKGADNKMIEALRLLIDLQGYDDARKLFNKYQQLYRACDSCAFNGGGDLDAATKALDDFICEL